MRVIDAIARDWGAGGGCWLGMWLVMWWRALVVFGRCEEEEEEEEGAVMVVRTGCFGMSRLVLHAFSCVVSWMEIWVRGRAVWVEGGWCVLCGGGR